MKTCNNCGKPIGDECDGVMTLGPDPFASEIHEDYTEYWNCEGGRYESMMDI